MRTCGLRLNEDLLRDAQIVEFEGRSIADPKRTLRIRYPDGYPSFAPDIISPISDQVPPLTRHHSPGSGTLCCFGFNESAWSANMDGVKVVLTAERIIGEYQPGATIPRTDVVPEPRVAHYDYAAGSALLIPAPFGDMPLERLRTSREAQLRLSRQRQSIRGVLSSLRFGGSWQHAEPDFDKWAPSLRRAVARNALIRVLDSPPPLHMSHEEMQKWLEGIGVAPQRKHTETLLLLVFPDEWGDRFRVRPTWLAVRLIRNRAQWIRCHVASRDDARVRVPHGEALASKDVLVIGCGSLGSAMAVNLAQEGIGAMTLVDADVYEPGNAVRHQVAIDGFGRPKVSELANRIRGLCPAVKTDALWAVVGSEPDDACRSRMQAALERADLVVDAGGSQSLTHYLNRICTQAQKPLVVASVTNGVWAAEVHRYRPGRCGCHMCWLLSQASETVPSAPLSNLRFAPGCNQPTFVGGSADVTAAAGTAARMVTETLVDPDGDTPDYLVVQFRDKQGRWAPQIESRAVPSDPRCQFCRT